MLVDIVSRLVDFVGDPSPDVQGYVMEILLTLAAAVDNGVGEIKWLDDGFSDADNDDDPHVTATTSHEYDGTAGAYLRIRRVSRTQRESSMPIRTTAQHFPNRKLTGSSGGGGGDFLNPSDVSPMKRSASTSFESFVATSSTSKGDVVVERKRPFSLVAARAGAKGGALSLSFDGGGGGAESDPELAAAFRSSFTKEPSADAAIASASRRVGSNHSPSPHGVASAAVVVGGGGGGKQQGAGTRRVPSPGEFRELLSRLFWVASAVLTSDYEHEFLMAVRLMNKVL